MSVIELAQGRWPEILYSLGVDPKFLRNIHGACPWCGGNDRFRFDDKGKGMWYCNQCLHGDGMDFVQRWFDEEYSEAAERIENLLGHGKIEQAKPEEKKDPRPRLRAVYGDSVRADTNDNVAAQYLRSRSLSPTAITRVSGLQPYWEDRIKIGDYRCMVHTVSDANGFPATLHLTYLDDQGLKAPVKSPRKILPPRAPWQGGAVRLHEPGPVMIVAEGIESALAGSLVLGRPAWAALNANNMEQFMPPPEVQMLYILGDNDHSFTGQKAAFTLANRLAKKMPVSVLIPETLGWDFADVWENRDDEDAYCWTETSSTSI